MPVLKERLMNIADETHSTEETLNRCGFRGTFLVWIILPSALASHTPAWSAHSLCQWCSQLLTPPGVSCTTLTDWHLPGHTHTHWIKRIRMRQQASPWTNQSEITFCTFSKITPMWSAAVTREMRKYQTITNDVKRVLVDLLYRYIWLIAQNNHRLSHTCNFCGLLPFQCENLNVHAAISLWHNLTNMTLSYLQQYKMKTSFARGLDCIHWVL